MSHLPRTSSGALESCKVDQSKTFGKHLRELADEIEDDPSPENIAEALRLIAGYHDGESPRPRWSEG